MNSDHRSGSMVESGRAGRLFGLILLLILLAFYYPWLHGDNAFYRADITFFFEPLSRFMGESFRHGRLPLWNPYVACGVPQIAEIQPGIFYLFNLLFVLLPFSKALAVFLTFHHWIAGVGGFLLVETLGWGFLPCAIAGFVFALNGYMFSLESIYPLMATAAWVPFTLYLTCRIILQGGRLPTVLALSVVIAFLVTAGRPEAYGPGIATVLAWSILHTAIRISRGEEWKKASIPVLLVYLAVLIGVLLAMPSILPPMEWIPLSLRSGGLNSEEVLSLSADWYDFLCLFAPQPLGDFHTLGNNFFEVAESLPGITPFVSSAFIGPLVILLAIFGALDHRWAVRWILVSVLAFTLIMSAGNYIPGMAQLVIVLPVLSLFRYPIKALIFAVWSCGLLAAAGSRLIEQRAENKSKVLIAAIFIAIIFATGSFLLVATECKWLPIYSFSSKKNVASSVLAAAQHLIGLSLVECSGMMFLGLVLVVLHWRKKIGIRALSACVLALVVGPLLMCAFSYSRHLTEIGYFDRPSFARDRLAEFAGRDFAKSNCPRVAELYPSVLIPPPWYHSPGGKVITYADMSQYARQMLDPNTNIDFHIPSVFAYELGVTRDYSTLFHSVKIKSSVFSGKGHSDVPLARFCRMTNAKFVLCQEFVSKGKNVQQLDSKLFDLLFHDEPLNLRIYGVRDVLPRAYLIGSWHWHDGSKEILDALANADNPDFDVSQCAYLQRSSVSRVSASEKSESTHGFPGLVGSAELTEENPEHQTVRINGKIPAVLIVADQFYPGWRATLDGSAADIFKANGFQRAVLVPPGTHEVKFMYEPGSLANGLRLSAVGFGLWLSILSLLLYWSLSKSQEK